MSIVRVQVYVAFIPMLAMGKRGVAQCHHCGQPVTLKEGGESFKNACQALKATVRTPLYLYSGLILCVLGMATTVGTVAYQESHNPNTQPIEQALLDAPQVGDLYEVSVNGTNRYASGIVGHTVARVERTGDGLVTLRWHRKMVPIDQKMPFVQDFAIGADDFGSATVEAQAARLRQKVIVRQGARNGYADEAGSIVATLRPKAK